MARAPALLNIVVNYESSLSSKTAACSTFLMWSADFDVAEEFRCKIQIKRKSRPVSFVPQTAVAARAAETPAAKVQRNSHKAQHSGLAKLEGLCALLQTLPANFFSVILEFISA